MDAGLWREGGWRSGQTSGAALSEVVEWRAQALTLRATDCLPAMSRVSGALHTAPESADLPFSPALLCCELNCKVLPFYLPLL